MDQHEAQDAFVWEASRLTRLYGDKAALDGFSASVPAGGVAGLLGRNGAGKSTLLRILTGQDLPTGGTARVFGGNPFDNPGVLRRVCLVPDHPEFGALRTVKEALAVHAALYPGWDAEAAPRLLERFELKPKLRLKALSRGMQTALGLVIGLASGAPFTLFDEPSLGLDAVMRERFYDLLVEYKSRPGADGQVRTFLISTHLIEEAARTLDWVVLIESGRFLADGTVASLTADAYLLFGADCPLPEGASLLREEDNPQMGRVRTVRGPKPDPLPPGVFTQPVSLQRLFVLMTDPSLQGDGH